MVINWPGVCFKTANGVPSRGTRSYLKDEHLNVLECNKKTMMTAAKIVVDVVLDAETLGEIEMLRSLRLAHYEQMAQNPGVALENLKRAGLQEASSSSEIAANALAKIRELKDRIATPNVIYEDELAMYVHTLSLTDLDNKKDSR